MYSNDYTQIRSGLTNYVGSLLKACPHEGMKASRQFVAATLIEEALKLINGEDNVADMYVAKPLLRANTVVLRNRMNQLYDLPQIDSVKQTLIEYDKCATYLTNLVNDVKE